MKKLVTLIISVLFICLITPTEAQIKVDVKGKATEKANERANNKTDEVLDKGFDKLEEGIGKLFGKKKKKKKKSDEAQETEEASQPEIISDPAVSAGRDAFAGKEKEEYKPNLVWSKFDFVSGDNIILEDGPDIMEENGEFPSRWDLYQGQTEIANVDGENVIALLNSRPGIVPYMKDMEADYLPDVFTIEFDIYRPGEGSYFYLYLYDKKHQEYKENPDIEIDANSIRIGDYKGELPVKIDDKIGRWMRISIAYTKGKLKMYMDDTRLINIPHYEANPSGFTISCYWAEASENKAWYMKNFRMAEGGVKYYNRFMQDGKIVCNGIRFDVGKASLKPESMGPINKIYELLSKKPDIKFSIEGHTDSDGDDNLNMQLSAQRAETVKNKLVEMGIDASRLKFKGWGESKPIADNSSPEGKANNRRVEFVKL